MVVQHNLTAMNSNRMLGLTTASQAKSTEKLSSGYKINRAADDAAGLTISEKMRRQIRGLNQATLNAQDGISAVQTAEGALTEVHDMLQRMDELATKAANGTMSEKDRQAVQDEMDSLITEIDRVSTTTKFNEIYLLKGDPDSATTTTKTNYKYELTQTALDAEKGEISLKSGAAAVYGAGETSAVTGATAATAAVDATVEVTTGTFTVSVDDQDKLNAVTGTQLKYVSGEWRLNGTKVGTDGSADDVKSELGIEITGSVSNNNEITITPYQAAGAASDGSAGAYVEVADDGSIKYKEGQVLYLDAADTANEYGAQLTPIAESALGTYFETSANPLTDSNGAKITDLSSYFKDGVYQGGIYRMNSAATPARTEIGAEQIGNYVHVDDSDKMDVTTAEALKFSLHVGSESDKDNKIDVEIEAMSANGIGVDVLKTKGVMTQDDATSAIDTITKAIDKVSSQRSKLGAIQNRLEHTINNLGNVVENTTSAESAIRDTDMATEMVKFANNNILAQAGQSMLAQANQTNQGVLSLLG